MNKFKSELINDIHSRWLCDVEDCTNEMLRISIANVIRRMYIDDNWIETEIKRRNSKQVNYMCMGFMVGKMLEKNLINLDRYEQMEEDLKELGIDIRDIIDNDTEVALGNGGLELLASEMMQSAANIDKNVVGQGLLYSDGFFKQRIVEDGQIELPEQWFGLDNIHPLAKPLLNKAVIIKLYGKSVCEYGKYKIKDYTPIKAIPILMPIIGYRNNVVNSLILWKSEPLTIDELKGLGLNNLINSYDNYQSYIKCCREITSQLYPNDETYEGKMLRMKQEYLLSSSGVQLRIREYKNKGKNILDFGKDNLYSINDSHCSFVAPSLFIELMDNEGLTWEQAESIVKESVGYTSHTLLAEAIERWNMHDIRVLLPRVAEIIEELNRRQNECGGKRIIQDNTFVTANMLIEVSHHINGVAKIQSDLLKTHTFKEMYEKYPNKFTNVTNGISNKWMLVYNKEVKNAIDKRIGEDWAFDFFKLKELENHYNEGFRNELMKAKVNKKIELAKLIKEQQGYDLNIDSMICTISKRFHMYKRNHMVMLYVVYLYRDMINNPMKYKNFKPMTFILSGKAAPGYKVMKSVIRLTKNLSKQINEDSRVNDKLQLFIIEDYNVTIASKLLPATDLSIQCSTATYEASGTSNEKVSLLGTPLLMTMDGANIEIVKETGEENQFVFGLRREDVSNLYSNGSYNAWELYHHDAKIKDTMDCLLNGFIHNAYFEGKDLYYEIMNSNDHYFTLIDFLKMIDKMNEVINTYEDKEKWYNMAIKNISVAGQFQMNRCVKEYCDRIWNI